MHHTEDGDVRRAAARSIVPSPLPQQRTIEPRQTAANQKSSAPLSIVERLSSVRLSSSAHPQPPKFALKCGNSRNRRGKRPRKFPSSEEPRLLCSRSMLRSFFSQARRWLFAPGVAAALCGACSSGGSTSSYPAQYPQQPTPAQGGVATPSSTGPAGQAPPLPAPGVVVLP